MNFDNSKDLHKIIPTDEVKIRDHLGKLVRDTAEETLHISRTDSGCYQV